MLSLSHSYSLVEQRITLAEMVSTKWKIRSLCFAAHFLGKESKPIERSKLCVCARSRVFEIHWGGCYHAEWCFNLFMQKISVRWSDCDNTKVQPLRVTPTPTLLRAHTHSESEPNRFTTESKSFLTHCFMAIFTVHAGYNLFMEIIWSHNHAALSLFCFHSPNNNALQTKFNIHF